MHLLRLPCMEKLWRIPVKVRYYVQEHQSLVIISLLIAWLMVIRPCFLKRAGAKAHYDI